MTSKNYIDALSNPHSTMIGLWSHWWLSIYKDGYVKDGALGVENKNGEKNYADLNFYGEKGEMFGAIEVETTYNSYLTDVENLLNYPRKYKNLEFLILHVEARADEDGNYGNFKATQCVKDAINGIRGDKSFDGYWIVVISKWISEQIDFDGLDTKCPHIGHEWLIFKNGKELKEYWGQTDMTDKINYTD